MQSFGRNILFKKEKILPNAMLETRTTLRTFAVFLLKNSEFILEIQNSNVYFLKIIDLIFLKYNS